MVTSLRASSRGAAAKAYPAAPTPAGRQYYDNFSDAQSSRVDRDFTIAMRVNPFVPSTENANFDETGVVDAADLAQWKPNVGTGTTHLQGNADGDTDVDGNDFLVWQRQLGTTPAVVATAAAIPEPASAAIALVATVGLAIARRRTR